MQLRAYTNTTHEIKAHQQFMDAELNKYFAKVYAGFLTPKEMKAVIAGKDLWMGKDEVEERWARRQAFLASGEPATPPTSDTLVVKRRGRPPRTQTPE